MKSSVITFPGSNCDRDMDVALKKFGFKNKMVWHSDSELPKRLKDDFKAMMEIHGNESNVKADLDREANIEAWDWYLGGKNADEYAAPARAIDLSGLPPTFIDVGELDLFRDEDIEFAKRLLQAGVTTELHVYPGAYHASESFAPEAELSKQIWTKRIEALKRALKTNKIVYDGDI